MPGAFIPGATESSPITLSEQALTQGLKANLSFAKLGVNLRLAVNIPVNALVKVGVADIVQTYRPQFEKWPGLIIGVMEEQIVTELALAQDIAKKLRPLDVHLAIDDFGRGYSSLARVKELCRLPNSSSTASSSAIAAATKPMRRYARPSSISRTVSAASPWGSASKRRPKPSP